MACMAQPQCDGLYGGHNHTVLGQCDACMAFDKAPRVPMAGTSTVSMLNEKVQVDPLLLVDLVDLRTMDMFPKYSLLLPTQSENPQ